jgi:hypothetical protein
MLNVRVFTTAIEDVMAKSSEPTETLRKGKLPPAQAAKNPTVTAGAAAKSIKQQVGENGNPKHRTRNEWGVATDSEKN